MSKKQVKSLDFLPEVFKTTPNKQFLSATLDQLTQQPDTTTLQGFIGAKYGYGLNQRDNYIVESDDVRTNYQLTPAIVSLKKDSSVAKDFLSYPGIVDALRSMQTSTENESGLFANQYYAWDPLVDLDKLVNFAQYCWLPQGPDAVEVTASTVDTEAVIKFTLSPAGYTVTVDNDTLPGLNPTLTLARGGKYNIVVNQPTRFWIQGKPGVTGFDPQVTNVYTRDILGVSDNGSTTGAMTFTVPDATAQSYYDVAGSLTVDLVTTAPYSQVNNRILSALGGIDGITALNGKTILFYNSEVATNSHFYVINLVGDVENPTVVLTQGAAITNNTRITVRSGDAYQGKHFFRDSSGEITQVPYLSASMTTLYYQDEANENAVGVINIVADSTTEIIDVTEDILGKVKYTSTNGVVFTNGLKVYFTGDVFPVEYQNGEYYVEGVGTGIQLINTNTLCVVEEFAQTTLTGYDIEAFDASPYDGATTAAKTKDYITIGRASADRNPWSRSNRWFHVSVLEATAQYTNSSVAWAALADQTNRAKRPIIEFYPNIRLHRSGTVGKELVDYFVTSSTVNFVNVTRRAATATSSVTNRVTLSSVTGLVVGQMVVFEGSSFGGLFVNTPYFISAIDVGTKSVSLVTESNSVVTLTTATPEATTWFVSGDKKLGSNIHGLNDVAGSVECYLDISMDTPIDPACKVFDGARIVFASDTVYESRAAIYEARVSQLVSGGDFVITLRPAADSSLTWGSQVPVRFGVVNKQNSYYYVGNAWAQSQDKKTVNQAPLFDVFDINGVSLSSSTTYPSTNFAGTKLFGYAVGTGADDPILKLPLRYTTVTTVGDIEFESFYDTDTFNYTGGNETVTKKVNSGLILQKDKKLNGWAYAPSESIQYQVYEDTLAVATRSITLDVPVYAATASKMPVVKLYVDGVFVPASAYTITIAKASTVIGFATALVAGAQIQLLFQSASKSAVSYFELPNNLVNNPFNGTMSTVTTSDLRSHYSSICENVAITGGIFGKNNYRDLGSVNKYATKIVQHSASLVNAGLFLRNHDLDLMSALEYNANEYVKIKALIIDLASNMTFDAYMSPAQMLDDVMEQIAAVKTEDSPFFWSDMLPSRNVSASSTYFFGAAGDTTTFRLSRTYIFNEANYSSVLVYLSRLNEVTGVYETEQLLRGIDYTVSESSPYVTVTRDLVEGDQIIVNEYDETFGTFVPNTPAKMGILPATVPGVSLDRTYLVPTYVLRGHDGSISRVYGDAVNGHLTDPRDIVMLEFERRIFNNIKANQVKITDIAQIVPGAYRSSLVDRESYIQTYWSQFMNWVGKNRVDYHTNVYQSANEFTWNYYAARDKNGRVIPAGHWRGIYLWYFDTANPAATPWEMLGYVAKPTWWESRYGAAPYTINNELMWSDIENGYDYNNGQPFTNQLRKRPGMRSMLPVDTKGNLLSPWQCLVDQSTYNRSSSAKRAWRMGDFGPAEYSYYASSTYGFDLTRLIALYKPAKFFGLCFDTDEYEFDSRLGQIVNSSLSREFSSQTVRYSNGAAQHGYVAWLIDYAKQFGLDAATTLTDLITNVDVRLTYRIAGFSDKDMLKFYIEKASLNSSSKSLLVPDENYSVLLYNNQQTDQLTYSAVIVQRTDGGYKVWGNSQYRAYFETVTPLEGDMQTVTRDGVTIQLTNEYTSDVVRYAYGHEFYSLQSLCEFLQNYGRYLELRGMVFDYVEEGEQITWGKSIADVIAWSQTGWAAGSVLSLNPAASQMKINVEGKIVQPLTLHRQNYILNQRAIPIDVRDLDIDREENTFVAKPIKPEDALSFAVFNFSSIEHAVVFDNTTIFGDTLYDLTTGLRQQRMLVAGTKTANWNGYINTSGFILNQDNILDWAQNTKYAKGMIVKYKNAYWIAPEAIQPAEQFDATMWVKTEYEQIQKGLLPNPSTRAFESTLFYDIDRTNLESDGNLLSFSLIGYRSREYMAAADLSDTTQVNVFQNFTKQKGTAIAANAFKNAKLLRGEIDYTLHENWAIKTGEFGGILNRNFIDVPLQQSQLNTNPAIVSVYDAEPGAGMSVHLRDIINYGQGVTDEKILPVISGAPYRAATAGYVHPDQVAASGFTLQSVTEGLNTNDYLWLADDRGTWQVLSPASLGSEMNSIEAVVITNFINNLDGTVSFLFSMQPELMPMDRIMVTSSETFSGFFEVLSVVDRVVLVRALTPISETSGEGLGQVFVFKRMRVETPASIGDLNLASSRFTSSRVWVDSADNGWAVYQKDIAYKQDRTIAVAGSESFGSAIAYQNPFGSFVADYSVAKVHRFTTRGDYVTSLIGTAGFGAAVAMSNDGVLYIATATGVNVYSVTNSAQLPTPKLTQTINTATQVTSIAVSGDSKWLVVGCASTRTVYVYSRYQDYSRVAISGAALDSSVPAGSRVFSIPGNFTSVFTPGTLFSFSSDPRSTLHTVVSSSFSASRTSIRVMSKTDVAQTSGTALYLAEADYTLQSTYVGTAQGFGSSVAVSHNGSRIVIGAPDKDFDVTHTNTGEAYLFSNTLREIEVQATGALSIDIGWTPSAQPIVFKNGVELTSSQFTVTGSTLTIANVIAGDIVTVQGGNFFALQVLTPFASASEASVGVQFGKSVAISPLGDEIFVGAPNKVNSNVSTGAVYRFTDSAKKSGVAVFTPGTNGALTLMLNGYTATVPAAATAEQMVARINSARLTNIVASVSGVSVVVGLNNPSLAAKNNLLTVGALSSSSLSSLKYTVATRTQIITAPDADTNTGFGVALSIDERGSLAIGAPSMTQVASATFDFIDDLMSDDTIFDNGATVFVDRSADAGSVFVYDYLPGKSTSSANGSYVFGQAIYDATATRKSKFGAALSFADGRVIVGVPSETVATGTGKAVIFTNATGSRNWHTISTASNVVDINKINSIQIYSSIDNSTLGTADYIDPVQGKLLGIVHENVDHISSTDPAGYNSAASRYSLWSSNHVGAVWFDTSKVRFLDCYQPDMSYNSQYWGTVFPGSDVAVYTWVESNVTPDQYAGPGTARANTDYVASSIIDASGSLVNRYYFWARNTNTVTTLKGKTLPDTILEQYIGNPQSSGVAFMAPLAQNTFALYNAADMIHADDSVLHVGFAAGTSNAVAHQEFSLIRTDYPDDFLSGLPTETSPYTEPRGLYAKFLDSLSGATALTSSTVGGDLDQGGDLVPDMQLPVRVRYGTAFRPRQSMFVDRLAALKNYVGYANEVMKTQPIAETRAFTFMREVGPLIESEFGNTYAFDTTAYWEYTTWWAEGYSDATRSSMSVPKYADLAKLRTTDGLIATVMANSDGKKEVYRYATGAWERIGLYAGTVQIKDALWNYTSTGFGTQPYGNVYDAFPAQEAHNIIRSLNEEIFTGDLVAHRNKALCLMLEFVQREGLSTGNYTPWLTKTSFVDVTHSAGTLTALAKYQRDSQEFLEGYINEVKPYHVVIKDFQFKYTGSDVYQSVSTDFDLPAKFNSSTGKFESPQLVYSDPQAGQYLPSASIWTDPAYANWKSTYGLKLSGAANFAVTKTAEYISTKDSVIYVENALGMPVTGAIKIDSEWITYTTINRLTGQLGGIGRGAYNTSVTPHEPETSVYMNLGGALVLHAGRGYSTRPRIVATLAAGFPAPSAAAQFRAEMSGDSVVSITVLGQSSGYAARPEIEIAPAFTVSFDSTKVNYGANTIQITTTTPLLTGDLVKYVRGTGDIIGLLNTKRYYIRVIDQSNVGATYTQTIAFYTELVDLDRDEHRVFIHSATGANHMLEQGAYAIPIISVSPVRRLATTMKFDRTSFKSQVTDWVAGTYYAGSFKNTMKRLGNLASTDSVLYQVQAYADRTVTGGTGSNAKFTVFNSILGAINVDNYRITFTSGGTGYKVGDELVIFGNQLGGSIPQNDLRILIEDITVLDPLTSTGAVAAYTVIGNAARIGTQESIAYTGVSATNVISSGSGAIATVTRLDKQVPPGITYSLSTSYSAGAGYTVNDVLTIPGSMLGGVDGANDAEITVLGVNGAGAIIDYRVTKGSGVIALRTNSITRYTSIPGHMTVTGVDTSGTTTKLSVVYNGSVYPSEIDGEKVYFNRAPVKYENVAHAASVTGSGARFNVYTPVYDTVAVKPMYHVELAFVGGVEQVGSGYKLGQHLRIPGDAIGGESPRNDVLVEVSYVTGTGQIGAVTVLGLSPFAVRGYYAKVVSDTEIELYNYPTFAGVVTDFDDTFAGDTVYGYVAEFTNYAQSMVLHDGRLYVCTQSNNDTEFDYAKWQEIQSGDPRLNALDRIQSFYAPTTGMPGKDLTQLVKGLSYENAVYTGNPFDPESVRTLDAQVTGQRFSDDGVTLQDVFASGTGIMVVGDTPTRSISMTADLDRVVWSAQSALSSSTPMEVTSGTVIDGVTYVTTKARSSLMAKSNTTWATLITSDDLDANKFIKHGDVSVVVGNKIMIKTGTGAWSTAFEFTSDLPNTFTDVGWFSLPAFEGFIAVGFGYEYDDEGAPQPVSRVIVGLLDTDTDEYVWSETANGMTDVGLRAVAANNELLVAVGYQSRVFYSVNSGSWTDAGVSTGSTLNSVAYSPELSMFVAVGDAGEILTSSDGIVWTRITSSLITTYALNSVKWIDSRFIAVGERKTMLFSVDGTTWTVEGNVTTPREAYDLRGDEFVTGHSPEEMVSGIVSDSVMMTVHTLPTGDLGGYQTVYNSNGFKMTSFFPTLLNLSSMTMVSFNNVTATPINIAVYEFDVDTKLGRLMAKSEYTVDWKNQVVELSLVSSSKRIMVELYEPGNGMILMKSNTNLTPVINGHEIYLPISASMMVDTIHPVYKNGVELDRTTDYDIDVTLDGMVKLVFHTPLTEDDYVAWAIMGEATPEVMEFKSTGTAPQSFTLVGGLKDFFTDTASGSGLVYLQDPDTLQWTAVQYSDWSVSSGVVTVTSDLLQAGMNVRTTMKPYGSPDVITSTNPVITLTEAIAAVASYDSIIVQVDGVQSTAFTLSSDRKTVTVSAPGTMFKVFTKLYSLPETTEWVATTGQTVFTFDEKLSSDNISNAIVIKNGLRMAPGTYTLASGSLTLTAQTAGTVITMFTFDNTRNQLLNTYNWTGKVVSAIERVVVTDTSVTLIIPSTHGLVNGDFVYVDGFDGFTSLNGRKLVAKDIASAGAGVSSVTLYVRTGTVDALLSAVGVDESLQGGMIMKASSFQLTGVTQSDTSRMWVTINGYRVAAEDLRLYEGNALGILLPVASTDRVVVTTTTPTAAPDQLTYRIRVDKLSEMTVYRAPAHNTTWVTEAVTIDSTYIKVHDVTALVSTVSRRATVETQGGRLIVDLNTDRNETTGAMVYNISTEQWLNQTQYKIELVDLAPTIVFADGVSSGDHVEVTAFIGNTALMNGELIRFSEVDYANNMITGLTRGTNITAVMEAGVYAEISGITPVNLLNATYHGYSWNTTNYNVENALGQQIGDPLQLSTTTAARFLKSEI